MRRVLFFLTIVIFLLTSCGGTPTPLATPAVPSSTAASAPASTPESQPALYTDPSQPIETRVQDLLSRMTLEEKIGQMTQVEKNSIQPADVTKYFIGSVLSGGGGSPDGNNTVAGWYGMVNGYQQAALQTRLGIPMIYGVDAVHGHGNLKGATIFSQQIGLGAAHNPELVEAIGRATAEEMLATGVPWNFAPVVAVPQDIRWGRTYESYAENTELVTTLSVAYLKGMQTPTGVTTPGQSLFALATPKHFLGDGGTAWGTSIQNIFDHPYQLDQGDMQVDEAAVRALYLPPYKAAVDAGAMSIMVSFSSWNGTKMHAQKYLLTDVLKGELGFDGFLVSDWQAIDQISSNYKTAVVTSINAGLDMVMVPYDYVTFIKTLKQAVDKGDVPIARIDDAVRRILTAKFALGLFENPMPDPAWQATVRSDEHLALARDAVRQSLVLLKNEGGVLPLAKDTPLIYVAGAAADDIGRQCGGWTIDWQGKEGAITPGTTILEGIEAAVSAAAKVEYKKLGQFEGMADIGIAVIGEKPYTEGVGDEATLALSATDVNTLNNLRPHVARLIVVIVSGRPLVLTDQLLQMDALVAAWLPGTEGQGVADVLFGDFAFTGKLPYSWPRADSQLPFDFATLPTDGCDAPLFPYGYGLDAKDASPVILDCAND